MNKLKKVRRNIFEKQSEKERERITNHFEECTHECMYIKKETKQTNRVILAFEMSYL